MRKIFTLMMLTLLALVATAQKHAANGSLLKAADSLFTIKEWKTARENYIRYLKDTSKNALAWNRLGYCNHNLGKYDEAMNDYQRSLANNPSPFLKSVVS